MTSKTNGSTSVLSHESEVHEVTPQTNITLGWRSWSAVVISAFAILAQTFVVASAGVVAAFVAQDLGDYTGAGWIIQAPLLMQSISAPIVGRLSDVFDRKTIAAPPALIAMVGALVCIYAKTLTTLVVGSCLIGLALSTSAVVQAIPSEVLPRKYRVVANSTIYLGSGIGGLAGSLGAGALTNRSPHGWRHVFVVQAVLHGVTFAGLLALSRSRAVTKPTQGSFKKIIWSLDPYGSLFFASSTALTLLALNWAKSPADWSTPRVLAPLICGLVILLVFCLYETFGRVDGLVPHVCFKNSPNFAIAIFGNFVEGWIFYGAVSSITPQLLLNLGFENNAWSISLRNLAGIIPGMVCCLPITWYATRYKDMKYPLLVCFTVFFAVSLAYCRINPGQNVAQIAYMVLLGSASGGPWMLLTSIMQLCTTHQYLGATTGLASSIRAIAGAYGSAVLMVIANTHVSSKLPKGIVSIVSDAGLPIDVSQELIQLVLSGQLQTGQQPATIDKSILSAVARLSHSVYAKAYQLAWISVVPLTAIAIVAMAVLKTSKQQMTDTLDATVEPAASDNPAEPKIAV